MTTDHQGAVGDARKRRLPEIETDATTLRAQLEWMTEVAEAAQLNHRRADAKRVEALARVSELEHRLVVADENLGELERRLLIAKESGNVESGEHEHHRDRVAQLERSMRAVVLMLQDDQPTADVIQAISDALEVRVP